MFPGRWRYTSGESDEVFLHGIAGEKEFHHKEHQEHEEYLRVKGAVFLCALRALRG
jgi:hypothetical protein